MQFLYVNRSLSMYSLGFLTLWNPPGKWGATSFTSIRTGDQPAVPPGIPRAKKFFKSRTQVLPTPTFFPIHIVSSDQENSDSSELPSSEESLVTVSAAAVLPPVPSSPAPPPAKKFFKKSRIVEKETKEVADEGEGEEGLSSLRQRPRRPAQRTERMSPKPPVPRSPLQARSPLQVLLVFCSSD